MMVLRGKCRADKLKAIAGEIGIIILFVGIALGYHACHNGF